MAPARWRAKWVPLLDGLKLVWRSAPGWTAAQIGLLLALSVLPIAALYLTKAIVDAVAAALDSGGAERGPVITLILLAALVAALSAALRAIVTLVTEVQAGRLGDLVQDMLHGKSVSVDLQYYESSEYYDTLHRAQENAPYRPTKIVTALAQVGQGGLSLIALTGLLLTFHWALVAILLGAALPGLFVKAAHSNRLYAWSERQTLTYRQAWYVNALLTTMEYAKEVRLLDLGGMLRARYRELRARVLREKIALATRRTFADLLAQVVAVAAVFGSIAFIADRVLAGGITIGGMVMYFGAFQRAQDFFRDLLAGLASLYEDNLFLRDFSRFVSLEPAVADPPSPKPVPRPIREGIEFDRVSFTYPGTPTQVLHELSFTVAPGEHLALVGENGCGKTTLVKLLCRLYDPTSGAIRIDGVDLRELSVNQLRAALAVVFQDYARYQFSARDNIWIGNTALPRDSERIREAAVRTGADAVISALPKGYDTVLGRQYEDGSELSIGQWQKVALARAFARDAELIILDEPTAALDPLAEAEVFDRFYELAEGRTAIVISHRLSTVRHADRILVMDEGRIVEVGRHDELMSGGGLYAHLFDTQARPYR
ncbi:MAG: ABC transporter ATP-binding protein [Gemmatimonadales bacterium]